jgi:Fic family protein
MPGFSPQYVITSHLLKNITEIYRTVVELNHHRLSEPVLAKFETLAVTSSAYSSTSIEGNPLPLTEVRKILKNRPSQQRDSEKEVINYNDTLIWLNGLLKTNELVFNQQLILNVHSRLMQNLMPKIKLGKFRAEPVLVNDPKKGKPIYWPPDHQDVTGLMKNLISFLKENDGKIDPIILSGIFHKQFVIVHPFIDGNGRTVRLLTKALLAQMGLDTFHLFSFENYYNRNVSKYFSFVGELGDYHDLEGKTKFTDWLEYFSAGILDELLRVKKEIAELNVGELSNPNQLLSADQQLILSHIDKHGFIRDLDYSQLTKRAKSTRILDFKRLVNLNYIERFGKGPATYYKRKL